MPRYTMLWVGFAVRRRSMCHAVCWLVGWVCFVPADSHGIASPCIALLLLVVLGSGDALLDNCQNQVDLYTDLASQLKKRAASLRAMK